jgi:hypothetical protein
VAVALTPPAVAVARKLCQEDGSIQSHESKFTTLNEDGLRLIAGEGSDNESTAWRTTSLGIEIGVPGNTGEALGIHDRAPL